MASIREVYAEEYVKLYSQDSIIDNIFSACQNKRAEDIRQLHDNCSISKLIQKEQDTFLANLQGAPDSYLHDIKSITIGNETHTIKDENYVEALTNLAYDQCSDEPTSTIEVRARSYASPHTISAKYFLELHPKSHRIQVLAKEGEKVILEAERQDMLAKDTFDWLEDIEFPEIKDSLIIKLIKLGYITESYKQYLAPYQGKTESAQLRNFKNNNIKTGQPNYFTQFSNTEINDLLCDLDKTELRTNALYNFNVFDFLAEHQDKTTATSILDINMDNQQIHELSTFFHEYSKTHEIQFGACTNTSMMINYINKHPVLWLLSLISSKLPKIALQLTIENAYNNKTSTSIMLATTLLHLGIPIIEINNVEHIEALIDIDYEYIKRLGMSYEYIKLMTAHQIKIPSLKPFESIDIINYIVDSAHFDLSNENILRLSTDQLLRYLSRSDITISASEIQNILQVRNINPTINDYILHNLNKIDIKKEDFDTWNTIRKTIEKMHTVFTEEDIAIVFGNIPDTIVIAMLAYSKIGKEQLLDILKNLPDREWQKFGLPGKQPKVDYSPSAETLIEYLKALGIVSKYHRNKKQIMVSLKKRF